MRRNVGTKPGVPLDRASTIPSSWYLDPEHHRLDVDRILARTWQQVAREEQVGKPGDFLAVEVAGEPVLIARGRDGVLRAFYNVCRHRAGTVAKGDGCVKAFSCTYHGWSYGLDGALLGAPEMEGVRDFDRKEFGLVPVRCETWSGLVFVNLDPKAGPLARWMGPMPEFAARTRFASMRFARRDVYAIACNWKVYVDNFMEGYHVPKAHPGLNKAIDYKSYWVRCDGNVVTQGAPERAGGSEADYLYLWLYPNFMLNVSPGYAQTNLILPDGPERTTCIFDYWFADGAGPAERKRREASIAWSDEIQREDIALCESVQRNLASRSYVAGRYSVRRENGLYHFHEIVRRDLAAAKKPPRRP